MIIRVTDSKVLGFPKPRKIFRKITLAWNSDKIFFDICVGKHSESTCSQNYWFLSLFPSVWSTVMIENYTCWFGVSSHSLVPETSQHALRIFDSFGSCRHYAPNTIVSIVKYIFILCYIFSIYRVQGQGGIELKVFNLNTWGISWFDDEPTVSDEEPYDIQSVADTDLGVSIPILLLVYSKKRKYLLESGRKLPKWSYD